MDDVGLTRDDVKRGIVTLFETSQPSLARKMVTPIFSASYLDLAFTIPPDKGSLIARASFIQRTNAASRLGNKHGRIFFLLFDI